MIYMYIICTKIAGCKIIQDEQKDWQKFLLLLVSSSLTSLTSFPGFLHFIALFSKKPSGTCRWMDRRFALSPHLTFLHFPPIYITFLPPSFGYREIFLRPGLTLHVICIGTMPRLVQIETCFFGIIHCICPTFSSVSLKKICTRKGSP